MSTNGSSAIPVFDVSSNLVDASIAWSKRPADVEPQFEPWLRGITRGLYVLYLHNHAADAVYDKNGKFGRGGDGKLTVYGLGASLKPGKFENGFLRRTVQDADHLHRSRDERLGRAFRECLELALVLDLSARPITAVREGKQMLKNEIDAYLAGPPSLLRQGSTRSGDWRHLQEPQDVKRMKNELTCILERVYRMFAPQQHTSR